MQPQENPARVLLGLHGNNTEGFLLKNLYCLECNVVFGLVEMAMSFAEWSKTQIQMTFLASYFKFSKISLKPNHIYSIIINKHPMLNLGSVNITADTVQPLQNYHFLLWWMRPLMTRKDREESWRGAFISRETYPHQLQKRSFTMTIIRQHHGEWCNICQKLVSLFCYPMLSHKDKQQ